MRLEESFRKVFYSSAVAVSAQFWLKNSFMSEAIYLLWSRPQELPPLAHKSVHSYFLQQTFQTVSVAVLLFLEIKLAAFMTHSLNISPWHSWSLELQYLMFRFKLSLTCLLSVRKDKLAGHRILKIIVGYVQIWRVCPDLTCLMSSISKCPCPML